MKSDMHNLIPSFDWPMGTDNKPYSSNTGE